MKAATLYQLVGREDDRGAFVIATTPFDPSPGVNVAESAGAPAGFAEAIQTLENEGGAKMKWGAELALEMTDSMEAYMAAVKNPDSIRKVKSGITGAFESGLLAALKMLDLEGQNKNLCARQSKEISLAQPKISEAHEEKRREIREALRKGSPGITDDQIDPLVDASPEVIELRVSAEHCRMHRDAAQAQVRAINDNLDRIKNSIAFFMGKLGL